MLMTAGIAMSRKHDYSGWTPYQFPTLLSKLSRSKSQRELKRGLATKIGRKTHSSARQVISEDLPYFKEIISRKELAPAIAAEFEFDEKELAFLLNTKPETKKVQKILEQAKEIQQSKIKEKRRSLLQPLVDIPGENPEPHDGEVKEIPPKKENPTTSAQISLSGFLEKGS
jgi:replication factor C large subunit